MTGIQVEFFGIPRRRTNVPSIVVNVEPSEATLGDVLQTVVTQMPALASDCIDGRNLRPACIANFDGERFVRDSSTELEGCRKILLLSADAGG